MMRRALDRAMDRASWPYQPASQPASPVGQIGGLAQPVGQLCRLDGPASHPSPEDLGPFSKRRFWAPRFLFIGFTSVYMGPKGDLFYIKIMKTNKILI